MISFGHLLAKKKNLIPITILFITISVWTLICQLTAIDLCPVYMTFTRRDLPDISFL